MTTQAEIVEASPSSDGAAAAAACSSTATRSRTGRSSRTRSENFSTTTGQPTNAVFGFTSMLINALRDEVADARRGRVRPVAHDVPVGGVPGVQSRSEQDAGRVLRPAPADPRGARRAAHPGADKDNYEADDIIATIATTAERAGFDVLIVTGDRDCFQLVSEQVTVLYPKRGVSDDLAG